MAGNQLLIGTKHEVSRGNNVQGCRFQGKGSKVRKWGHLFSTVVLAAALSVASHAGAADKPVFGLVMSFSGWFQPIDADTIAGAQLAVDDINAAGGVLGQPIEI